MYMNMYMNMYIYIYMYIWIYVYACIYIYMYMYICLFLSLFIYIYIFHIPIPRVVGQKHNICTKNIPGKCPDGKNWPVLLHSQAAPSSIPLCWFRPQLWQMSSLVKSCCVFVGLCKPNEVMIVLNSIWWLWGAGQGLRWGRHEVWTCPWNQRKTGKCVPISAIFWGVPPCRPSMMYSKNNTSPLKWPAVSAVFSSSCAWGLPLTSISTSIRTFLMRRLSSGLAGASIWHSWQTFGRGKGCQTETTRGCCKSRNYTFAILCGCSLRFPSLPHPSILPSSLPPSLPSFLPSFPSFIAK